MCSKSRALDVFVESRSKVDATEEGLFSFVVVFCRELKGSHLSNQETPKKIDAGSATSSFRNKVPGLKKPAIRRSQEKEPKRIFKESMPPLEQETDW